jgi:hypothetical protein
MSITPADGAISERDGTWLRTFAEMAGTTIVA